MEDNFKAPAQLAFLPVYFTLPGTVEHLLQAKVGFRYTFQLFTYGKAVLLCNIINGLFLLCYPVFRKELSTPEI